MKKRLLYAARGPIAKWLVLAPKPALRVTFFALLCTLTLAVFAERAVGQGCAMCYQNAAASGAAGREALRHGILVLLLPAVSFFLGVFALIYRRRNATRFSGEFDARLEATRSNQTP